MLITHNVETSFGFWLKQTCCQKKKIIIFARQIEIEYTWIFDDNQVLLGFLMYENSSTFILMYHLF